MLFLPTINSQFIMKRFRTGVRLALCNYFKRTEVAVQRSCLGNSQLPNLRMLRLNEKSAGIRICPFIHSVFPQILHPKDETDSPAAIAAQGMSDAVPCAIPALFLYKNIVFTAISHIIKGILYPYKRSIYKSHCY